MVTKNKFTCAILDDYQNVALQFGDWSSIKKQVEVSRFSESFTGCEEIVNSLKGFDIIVIMRERTKFSADVLKRLPKLKLLVTSGMRNSAIDLDSAKEMGVRVCGTQSFKEPPTEMTWALILGLARNLVEENNSFRQRGPWQTSVGTCLKGKKLGLLGLGHIGAKVARVAKAFDMRVVAWSQNLTEDRSEEIGVELSPSKEALLKSCDFVSLHLVPGVRNCNIIGTPELNLMKRSAFLINTSRAALVDQNSLRYALENQLIRGAGLDVFAEEPLPSADSFRDLPNVLGTPHLGYVADKNFHAYFFQAVENIAAYLNGDIIREL